MWEKASKSQEQGAGFHHGVADHGQIARGLNGNNNIYPRGLSWGLKEMCSAWNTIDLLLIEAALMTRYMFLLAVCLLLLVIYVCVLLAVCYLFLTLMCIFRLKSISGITSYVL